MHDNMIDSKLKNLILLCKETSNYEKLAFIIINLINDKLNEIGIKLGLRPRNSKNELLNEYMIQINSFLENEINIRFFPESLILMIHDCEIMSMSNLAISKELIKKLINAYYELRKLKIPNLIVGKDLILNRFSERKFLFKDKRLNSVNLQGIIDLLNLLILEEIKAKENLNRNLIFNEHVEYDIEKLLRLKALKNLFEENKKNYFFSKENLKYYIKNTNLTSKFFKDFLLSLLFLFSLMSLTILIELILFPILLSSLSMLLFIFFGLTILLFLILNSQNGD
ncbi:MAG: hypothetical protein ACTSQP_22685 [Promethearchaeota archaeon]